MPYSEYAVIFDSELNILGKNEQLERSGLLSPTPGTIADSKLKITWLLSGKTFTQLTYQ